MSLDMWLPGRHHSNEDTIPESSLVSTCGRALRHPLPQGAADLISTSGDQPGLF